MNRTQRCIVALHEAGTDGLTIPELGQRAGIKPSEAKDVLHRLLGRKQAVLIAARRDPITHKLDEVWACRCRLDHRPKPTTVERMYGDGRPLDEATIARGLQGVADARAALDHAIDKK